MNIYFINRKSKWKGPFDVIDAKQKRIISVGDVCIYDTDEHLCFLIVVNDSNKWNACQKAGVGNNSNFNSVGNTLLFAFDSINHRHGNIKLLQELCECFEDNTIRQFFLNACEILRYKKDFWDSGVILNLYKTSSYDITSQKTEKNNVTTIDPVSDYPSIFTAYFDHDIIAEIITQVKNGVSLREVYTSLREYNPNAFRNALTRFLRDHPDKSIYDVPDKILKTEKAIELDVEDQNPLYEWYLSTPSYIDDNIETNQVYCDTEFNKFIDELETGDNSHTNISKSLITSVKDLKDSHQLSENYILTLLRRYRNGDLKARDQIINGCIHRIYSIALPLHTGDIPLEDLIQEGNIGLMYALEKFDYLRYRSFFSYVQYWIYRYIRNFLDNNQYFIRIPINKKKLHGDIHEFADKYEQEYGIEPSVDIISNDRDVNLDEILTTMSLPYNLSNVVEFSDDLDEKSNEDFLADESMMKESVSIDVLRLLKQISPRMGRILKDYYGIGCREKTLEEIGDSLRLTRERVRQIKEKSIKILRDILKRKKYAPTSPVKYTQDNDIEYVSIKRLFEQTKTNNTNILKNTNDNQKKESSDTKKTSSNNETYKNVRTYEHISVGREYWGSNGRCVVQKILTKGDDLKIYVKYKKYLDVITDVSHLTIIAKKEPNLSKTTEKPHVKKVAQTLNIITHDQSVKEFKGFEVGEFVIVYKRMCQIREIIISGIKVRIIVEYINGIRDVISNIGLLNKISKTDNNETNRNKESSVSETYQSKLKPIVKESVTIEAKKPLLNQNDIEKLWHVFDSKATSYKYFWFMSLVQLFNETKKESIPFKQLIIRMVANAWKYVFVLEGEFPKIDQLPRYLNKVKSRTYLTNSSDLNIIEKKVNIYYASEKLNTLLSPLLNNVPYRFLSPWIPFKSNDDVIEKSNDAKTRCPYSLHDDCITINEIWRQYIIDHYEIIPFIEKELESFLKLQTNQ